MLFCNSSVNLILYPQFIGLIEIVITEIVYHD